MSTSLHVAPSPAERYAGLIASGLANEPRHQRGLGPAYGPMPPFEAEATAWTRTARGSDAGPEVTYRGLRPALGDLSGVARAGLSGSCCDDCASSTSEQGACDKGETYRDDSSSFSLGGVEKMGLEYFDVTTLGAPTAIRSGCGCDGHGVKSDCECPGKTQPADGRAARAARSTPNQGPAARTDLFAATPPRVAPALARVSSSLAAGPVAATVRSAALPALSGALSWNRTLRTSAYTATPAVKVGGTSGTTQFRPSPAGVASAAFAAQSLPRTSTLSGSTVWGNVPATAVTKVTHGAGYPGTEVKPLSGPWTGVAVKNVSASTASQFGVQAPPRPPPSSPYPQWKGGVGPISHSASGGLTNQRPAADQPTPGTLKQADQAVVLSLFIHHVVELARSNTLASDDEIFWKAAQKLGELQAPSLKGLPDPDLFRAMVAVARRDRDKEPYLVFEDAKREPLHLEPALLNWIGFSTASLPGATLHDIWYAAWVFRLEQGTPLPTPPDQSFLSDLVAIIQGGRDRQTAQKYAHVLSGLQGPDPGYPLYCEPVLLEEMVKLALTSSASAAQVYAAALRARSENPAWSGVPGPVPDINLQRKIVAVARRGAAARRGPYTNPRDILNYAVAELLLQRLEAPGGAVEYSLLRAIIQAAVEFRRASASDVWRQALVARGAHEDLLWPPYPVPDDALLANLIYVARHVGGVRPEMILHMALMLLGRATVGQIADIRQQFEQGKFVTMAGEGPGGGPDGGGGSGDPQEGPGVSCDAGQACCEVDACRVLAAVGRAVGSPVLAIGCVAGWEWACGQLDALGDAICSTGICSLWESDEGSPAPEPLPIPEGQLGGACKDGVSCNTGLECKDGTCVRKPRGPDMDVPPDPPGPDTGPPPTGGPVSNKPPVSSDSIQAKVDPDALGVLKELREKCKKMLEGLDWQPSEQTAAYIYLDLVNPLSVRENLEYFTILVRRDNQYAFLPGGIGTENESTQFMQLLVETCAVDFGNVRIVASVHTHGRYESTTSEWFSPADIRITNSLGLTAYLGTPKGRMKKLEPGECDPRSGPCPGTDLGPLPPCSCYQ